MPYIEGEEDRMKWKTFECTECGGVEDQMNNDLKIEILREIVRVGIKTILAGIDPDKRYQKQFSSWVFDVIDDVYHGYGYTEVKVRFNPSPKEISRAEYVEGWLVWLRGEYGKQTVARLFAWASKAPLWELAQREYCHEKTINNRIDRSMAAIWNEFSVEQQITIEAINIPPEKAVNGFQIEKSTATCTNPIDGHAKCWIDGVGFMREGKRIRDGSHKAERREIHRDRPR